MAEHVRHILTKQLSDGTRAFYWNPSRALRTRGFHVEALGNDWTAAATRALFLNAQADSVIKEQPRSGPKSGTTGALIMAFQGSDEYSDLRPRTQKDYAVWLKEIDQTFGLFAIETMTKKTAKTWIKSVRKARGIAAAYHAGATLRRLMSFAEDEGEIATNPIIRIDLKAPDARKVAWTDAERLKFGKAAKRLGWPSMGLALELAYCIAQSPVDVWRLTWSQYDGKRIDTRRQKTDEGGAPIPLFPHVIKQLNALRPSPCDREGTILINEKTGVPWGLTSTRYKVFGTIRKAAGLRKELQFGDLRRTALTDLGAVGGTDDEIRGLSRHKTRGVVSVYVRPDSRYVEGAQRKRRAGAATE